MGQGGFRKHSCVVSPDPVSRRSRKCGQPRRAVPINRVPWVAMGRKLKQLAVLPNDNNCQNSTEKAAPVGMAVDKNQPAFLAWARAVEKEIETQLKADEARVVDTMK